MQLGIKSNVVAITHSIDGGQQRLDIDFFSSALGYRCESQAGNHFAVQGTVILLRLLLEFAVKAIRQILDRNRRHNEKTITQPFWLSSGGFAHYCGHFSRGAGFFLAGLEVFDAGLGGGV